MKKSNLLITLLLCIAMLFSLAACGSGTTYVYKLNHTSLTMEIGETEKLEVTSDPESEFTVTYASSDQEIAVVADDGTVTAVSAGTATISATVGGTTLTCSVTVNAASTETDYSYALNYSSIQMSVDDQKQLIVNVSPSKQISPQWSVADDTIVSVAENGIVTALKEGTTTITATVDGEVLTCTVTITAKYLYTLDRTKVSVEEGKTQQLYILVAPDLEEGDQMPDFTWVSDKQNIATVNDEGLVTAVAPGTANITATAGNVVLTCEVTVTAIEYEYTLSETSLTINQGETSAPLTVTVTPEKTLNITWSTSNDKVATVAQNGAVTGVGGGTAIITAAVDGQELNCTVYVVPTDLDVSATVSVTDIVGDSVNLTDNDDTLDTLYWEHYQGSRIDRMNNATDLISTASDLTNESNFGAFGDYKASISWTNGTPTAVATDNTNGVCVRADLVFSITVDPSVKEIRLYSGAWNGTNNTTLSLGGVVLAASEAFTDGSAASAKMISYAVEVKEETTVTLTIHPTDMHDGGNNSLVAIAILGEGAAEPEEPTTTVTFTQQTEMTGSSNHLINLTEVGTVDWMQAYHSTGADQKLNGSVIDVDSLEWTNSIPMWDYKAAFTWTDGTVCNSDPNEENVTGEGNKIADGTNNGVCGSHVSVDLNVTAGSSYNVILWVSGWKSTYSVQAFDSNGNILCTQQIATEQDGTTFAYQAEFSLTATADDTITFYVGCTSSFGGNCALAAVAVADASQEPVEPDYEYSLSQTEIRVEEGAENVTLTVNITPDPEEEPAIIWSTSDDEVATVENGVVTFVGVGEATITAEVGGQKLECKVTVTAKQTEPDYEYSLSQTEIRVEEGAENVTLTVNITPDPEEEPAIIWSTSDDEVATVENGVVTFVGAGEATITAEVGGQKLECKVTVTAKQTEPDYEYSLSQNTLTGKYGDDTVTLEVNITPTPDPVPEIIWSTSNENVAIVDQDGVVTFVGAGECVITASVAGQELNCAVTVSNEGAPATATASVTDIEGASINLTDVDEELDTLYWEHYQSGRIDQMYNATDRISTESDLTNGTNFGGFGDYKAGITWTNGQEFAASYLNTNGVCVRADLTFSITVDSSVKEIRLYTGAWRGTNNTTLSIGNWILAASESFSAEETSVGRMITYSINVTEETTLTLRLSPSGLHDGGNMSLVAIAVLGESSAPAATTTVSLTNKTEMTSNSNVFNLTELGTTDWFYTFHNQGPDEKKDGTAILSDTFRYSSNTAFWDYRAAFTWTDGTTCESDPSDVGVSGDYEQPATGTNNGRCGQYVSIEIALSEGNSDITLWAGGWQSTYYVEVIDSNGNILFNELIAEKTDGNKPFQVELAVSATKSETVKVVVYHTDSNSGGNCSLAAVAVADAAA